MADRSIIAHSPISLHGFVRNAARHGHSRPPRFGQRLHLRRVFSYSRKNLDAADKVERDLEKFPLTREIRKQLGRRHLNTFRDVNDLTGNRLTAALEQNLEHSRTLVVLCSPAARSSTYVGMEINRFAELRDANRIVPVLIAGVPNNERAADPAEWAFPDALSDALGDPPLAPDLNARGELNAERPSSPEARHGFSSSPALSA